MSAASTPDCPLSVREQTRNVVLFGLNTSLIYFAAPVLYVGITQAALCKRLNTTDADANLPASVYLWATPLPVLIAWYFPYVRLFKPLLFLAYSGMALAGAVVVAALLLPTSEWVFRSLLVHAGMIGLCNGVVWSFQWEVLGRGVSESRRGQAFALAYGAGPILAVVGSLASQLTLTGKLGLLEITPLEYPWNFAILFAASVPIMGLAAYLSTLFVIQVPAVDVVRQPFLAGVFGGLREYFNDRLILIGVIAYILMYAGGNAIQQNVAIYAEVQLGAKVEEYAGYQNTLRFTFKVVAGIILGWLLLRTNARFLMLVTGALCLVGVIWAMSVPGLWYLGAFGFLGAGELFGVYYPNYIMSCSPRTKIRRNMAYTNMLTAFVGFAPVMYGRVSDAFGGGEHGLEMSFYLAIGIMIWTLLLVRFSLVAQPRPRDADLEDADTSVGDAR